MSPVTRPNLRGDLDQPVLPCDNFDVDVVCDIEDDEADLEVLAQVEDEDPEAKPEDEVEVECELTDEEEPDVEFACELIDDNESDLDVDASVENDMNMANTESVDA